MVLTWMCMWRVENEKEKKDEKERKNEELIYDTERSIVPIIVLAILCVKQLKQIRQLETINLYEGT